MIYLIGGAPRCGKTTTAKYLSRQIKATWLASDTLEAEVMAATGPEDFGGKFPKAVARKETNNSNDALYGKYSPEQIANLYIRQSKAVWNAIEPLAETALREGRDLIVEGYHIQPEFVADLQKKLGSDNVKAVFLVKFDEELIEKQGREYTSENDWFTEKTEDERVYKKISKMIQVLSRHFQSEAEKYGFAVYNMESDFQKQVEHIASSLL